MHSIDPDEHAYSIALRLATERGYKTVEEFISQFLEEEGSTETEDYDRLFTPEVLAAVDRGLADAEAGRVFSPAEVETHLAQWREECRENRIG